MRNLRRVSLISLVGVIAFGAFGQSSAQDASPVPNLPRPDIAAMILTPADLPEPGYGLESGSRLTLDDEAAGAVAYRGGEVMTGPVAGLAGQLTAAGWQERYAASLALLASADPTRVDRRIVTYVTAYADPAGATAGFTLLEDETSIPTAADVPGSRPIAEQSEITRDTGTISGLELPFQSLDLTFRAGNITAGVLIYDNRNVPPEVPEIEALADLLLARIQDVLTTGGPGLGARALRLDAPAAKIPFHDEAYELRGDTLVPYVAEAPDLLATREVQYGLATDVYAVYQALVSGDPEPDDDPYLVIRLYRFANETAAAGWLAALPDQLRGQSDEYVEIAPLVGGLAAGDESVSLSYAFNASESLVTQGYLVAVRVGPVIARIQVDGLPQPPFPIVQDLAEAQAVCLADQLGLACPVSIPIPAGLLPEVAPATPSVPAATPTA